MPQDINSRYHNIALQITPVTIIHKQTIAKIKLNSLYFVYLSIAFFNSTISAINPLNS